MRIAVVVPMWNQHALTARCLRSLATLVEQPEWVIVVDNGSVPEGRPEVLEARPGTEVLRMPRNLGFAAGCNAGIDWALERGAEAVLLLNNDTVVDAHLVGELRRGLAGDPRVAAVGGKTLTDESPARIHTAYSVLTFNAPLVRVEGWLEPRLDRFGEECDVDSVSGGAILLRREALEDVGRFDEEYFAYHEDVDWCTRARQRGWRIRYVPAAVVLHRMHASTGGGYAPAIVYLTARNAVRFVRKHGSIAQKLRFGVYTAGSLLRDLPYRWRLGQLAVFRWRLRGLVDGLLGRRPRLVELGLQ